jgi:hypothetical protein
MGKCERNLREENNHEVYENVNIRRKYNRSVE